MSEHRIAGIRYYVALGESKTLKQWSQDPRCAVCYGQLLRRINKGVPLDLALI